MASILKLTFQVAPEGNWEASRKVKHIIVSFSPLIFLGPKMKDKFNITSVRQVTLNFGRITECWLWTNNLQKKFPGKNYFVPQNNPFKVNQKA
jgi:hypothetical protein